MPVPMGFPALPLPAKRQTCLSSPSPGAPGTRHALSWELTEQCHAGRACAGTGDNPLCHRQGCSCGRWGCRWLQRASLSCHSRRPFPACCPSPSSSRRVASVRGDHGDHARTAWPLGTGQSDPRRWCLQGPMRISGFTQARRLPSGAAGPWASPRGTVSCSPAAWDSGPSTCAGRTPQPGLHLGRKPTCQPGSKRCCAPRAVGWPPAKPPVPTGKQLPRREAGWWGETAPRAGEGRTRWEWTEEAGEQAGAGRWLSLQPVQAQLLARLTVRLGASRLTSLCLGFHTARGAQCMTMCVHKSLKCPKQSDTHRPGSAEPDPVGGAGGSRLGQEMQGADPRWQGECCFT